MYNKMDLYQIFDNISYYSIKFTIFLFSIQFLISYFLFFFQGLRMNRTLMSLSLASNEIGDKGAIKLGEVSMGELQIKSMLNSIKLD